MPKYMFSGTYTLEGARGFAADGGTKRRAAAEELAKSVGGSVDGYWFAFGGTDYYLVMDLPDNETAAAIGLKVGASGALSNQTTVLLTPEEIDAAKAKAVSYTPPGEGV